jgi:hypothetical protein
MHFIMAFPPGLVVMLNLRQRLTVVCRKAIGTRVVASHADGLSLMPSMLLAREVVAFS